MRRVVGKVRGVCGGGRVCGRIGGLGEKRWVGEGCGVSLGNGMGKVGEGGRSKALGFPLVTINQVSR